MYELLRRGSKYHIVESNRTVHSGHTPPQPLPDFPDHYPELDTEVWKQNLAGRTCIKGDVRDTIRQSWERCAALGVDPAAGKCWDIHCTSDLGEKYQLLKELTEDIQADIYSLVAGRGLLVTVSDWRGYLLGMYGDIKALTAAEKLNFGPGANWSESSVGTNAIGTALANGQSVQVVAREHFCESHRKWVCSAAPIFDLAGNSIGCFDISGPTSADHSHALQIALRGARLIESRLCGNEPSEFNRLSPDLISTLFNSVMTGLIYLRPDGRIATANPKAAVLLRVPAEQLSGAAVDQWFDVQRVLAALQPAPELFTRLGLAVSSRLETGFDGRIYPLLTRNKTLVGYLLIFNDLQKVGPSVPSVASPRHDPFQVVIGSSPVLRKAVERARRAAQTMSTILITGETGTGKEILAHAVHEASRRSKGPFVAVNCGAIPAELIQSFLFGYVEGAFTGARRGGSPGKFEQASGGTLFFDEIGDMPLAMQTNLLRVLEEGEITRVGGLKPIQVDVRILAATHRDLDARVKEGLFRSDLFYRLNVIRIHLAPLRERGNDIFVLAHHFIHELAQKLDRSVREVSREFYRFLTAYEWPGNVRELRHAIETAITLMAGDVLDSDNLPDHVRNGDLAPVPRPAANFTLQWAEEETIRKAYSHFQGNISHMAKALGIGRNTLYAKLNRFNIISSRRGSGTRACLLASDVMERPRTRGLPTKLKK